MISFEPKSSIKIRDLICGSCRAHGRKSPTESVPLRASFWRWALNQACDYMKINTFFHWDLSRPKKLNVIIKSDIRRLEYRLVRWLPPYHDLNFLKIQILKKWKFFRFFGNDKKLKGFNFHDKNDHFFRARDLSLSNFIILIPTVM